MMTKIECVREVARRVHDSGAMDYNEAVRRSSHLVERMGPSRDTVEKIVKWLTVYGG